MQEAVLKLMGTGFSVSPYEVSTKLEAPGRGLAHWRGIDYTLYDGCLGHAGHRFSWAHATRGDRHSEIPLFHVDLITTNARSIIKVKG